MSSVEKEIFRHLFSEGGEPFITGGTVRDRLLGVPVRDMDVVVFGMDQNMLLRALKGFGQVLTYGKSFQVYQVRGVPIEFSLPRSKETQEKVLIHKLARDAAGRDFTVNALYMHPLTEEIKDPLEGMEDIKLRCLRMTSSQAFKNDPLRVLRAVQLSSRMGFSVEKKTMEAMRRVSLHAVAQERIYEELTKWLMGTDPAKGWFIMQATGHVPKICKTEDGFRNVTSDVLVCGTSLRKQSANPALWMWGVLLSICMLTKGQHPQSQTQDDLFHWFIKEFGELSNHHEHTRYISKMLWGIKNFHHYAVRKPDIARLSLGVDVDELTLTMTGLMPFWHHIGKQTDVQQAMKRIKKLRPHEKIIPLVKGTDLKKWGFTEGKAMGMLLETAFQMQLEGVTKNQIEAYFIKHQTVLQKMGH